MIALPRSLRTVAVALRLAFGLCALALLVAPAIVLGLAGLMIDPPVMVLVAAVLLPAGALLSLAYWLGDHSRLWFVAYALFAVCVLGSPALTPAELLRFHHLYRCVAPGMTVEEVRERLDAHFPRASAEGWPRLHQTSQQLVIFLRGRSGRFEDECIILPLGRNGRVYSKEYQAD